MIKTSRREWLDDTAQGKGSRNDSANARGKDVLCDEYLSRSGRYADRYPVLVVMSVNGIIE